MTPQEIADSVKRLRGIDELYRNAPSMFLKARVVLRATSYPEAMRTINALVELVGEMNDRILRYEAMGMLKAAPIAALAKGKEIGG